VQQKLNSVEAGNPEINVQVDRDKMASPRTISADSGNDNAKLTVEILMVNLELIIYDINIKYNAFDRKSINDVII
jgi:HAE1 family hydrophobic/amphiphilic exporter-1